MCNIFYSHFTGSVLSKEKAESIESSDNGSVQSGNSARSTASGIFNADGTRFGPDNHSRARQKESTYNRGGSGHLNGLEPNQLQTTYRQEENNGPTGNYAGERQSSAYPSKPVQNLDIVPRGFSRRRNSEQTRATYPDFKRYGVSVYLANVLSIH
jgi:hypothetical protein